MDRFIPLIPHINRDKENFLDSLRAAINPLESLYDQIYGLYVKLDIDFAEGSQLDVLGEILNVSRYVNIPLAGIYFGFDLPTQGYDSGAVWKTRTSPTTGIAALSDNEYRRVLKAYVSKQLWDGSTEYIKTYVELLFEGYLLIVQDNLNMTMIYTLIGPTLSPITNSLFTQGKFTIKPAGVGVTYNTSTTPNYPVFGFDTQNELIAGYDSGHWGI